MRQVSFQAKKIQDVDIGIYENQQNDDKEPRYKIKNRFCVATKSIHTFVTVGIAIQRGKNNLIHELTGQKQKMIPLEPHLF